MAKLYPPYIEGTIPAFYGDSITVPFSMNRAVGKSDISGFQLVFKSIQTGSQLETLSSTIYSLENNTVTFSGINSSKIQVKGQSYKIQLAYVDTSGAVGYFSTVGIVKYTAKPSIEIEGLAKSTLNNHKYNYIGVYTTEDITEKMYSCEFKVYDQNKEIIIDTGEIIHNSLEDAAASNNTFTASEQFDLIKELDEGKNYYIQFLVTTTGLMELDSGLYQIVQGAAIPLENTLVVSAELNPDEGYIEVGMRPYQTGKTMTGKYALSRTSSKENFKSWNEIMRFSLNKVQEKTIWRDFTFEQGVEYQYAIFMIDGNNNYSQKVLSEKVVGDFEDMFLFDGERQLKVRFNPKVSSFKNVTQEALTTTIGGTYPVYQRNGHIKYKQFSISGLLSHLTDEAGYFLPAIAANKLTDTDNKYSIYLNPENFAAERDFKLEVLDWLSNGKTKLFRSPGEGNYLIKLTGVSLSPTDSLSRLIHTFSATANEIGECSHDNLVDCGIITDSLLIGLNAIYKENTSWIPLSWLKTTENYLNVLNIEKATGIKFQGISANTYVEINGSRVNVFLSSDFSNLEITSLKAIEGQPYEGSYFLLLYEEEETPEINSNISGIDYIDLPAVELYGVNDIYNQINYKRNLLTAFVGQSKQLSQLFSVQCERRTMVIAYAKSLEKTGTTLYSDAGCTKQITENNEVLYKVLQSSGNNSYIPLGYKDQGEGLPFSAWTTLTNDSNLYCLAFTDENGISTNYNITSSRTFTSENIDFDSLKTIAGSLGLKFTFSCRITSQNLTGDKDDISKLFEEFKTTVFKNQEELEDFLANLKNQFLGGNS